MSGLVSRLGRIAASVWFRNAVLALILANAVLVGLETSPTIMSAWGPLLVAVQLAIQALFVLEILIRLGAHGSRPLGFFRDGWNVFDFLVVGLSLVPAAGPVATVARLARVLRVARLVSALPELRLIIGTMLRSIPSMGHVVTLLGLLLYVYGIFGIHLFGRDDPEHWGSLPRALQALFQVLTLEGWVELQAAVLPRHPWAWAYFASFIVIAVFVVINLFIAVVINNLETTRREEELRQAGVADAAALSHLEAIRQRIDALEAELAARARSAGRRDDRPPAPRAVAAQEAGGSS